MKCFDTQTFQKHCYIGTSFNILLRPLLYNVTVSFLIDITVLSNHLEEQYNVEQ